ncbi:4969_t:CDS:2, partial [Ambispora gerdemannii]
MVKEGDVNGDTNIVSISMQMHQSVKDRNDLLDCGGEHHNEIDVIAKCVLTLLKDCKTEMEYIGRIICPLSQSASYEKGRKRNVRFLSPAGIDLGEWEFAAEATPAKAVGDLDTIKVPFLQIAGVCGQLLVEDL